MVRKAHDMTKTCKTTLKVGDVLNNKWVILCFIDKGGMGEVYRAHQSNLNRDVAIKVVSQEWLESIDEDDEEVETLVQRFRREVQSMDVKGSPHYMSPEHFFDFKRADQRADVYSLGKMLFEAVAGKITSGTTPFKHAKLVKAVSPFFQELDRIIQMATAESRDERTESVRDLLGQLERVIHGLEFQKQTEKPSGPYFVPALRVTGYGASAFAQFFGRRLPTQAEMLFAMIKGKDTSKVDADPATDVSVPQMEGMMGMRQMMGEGQNEMENLPEQERGSASPERNPSDKDSVESMGSGFLLPAASFSPNLLGIKGLNHEIGEWISKEGQGRPSGDESKTGRYAVIGGAEGAPKDNNPLSWVVERFPWEGFEKIGFRTVESAAVGDSAK